MSARRLVGLLAISGLALAGLVLPMHAASAQVATLNIDTFRTLRAGGCANPGDNFDLVIGGQTNQATVGVVMIAPDGTTPNKGSATQSSGRWQTSVTFSYSQTGTWEIRASAGGLRASAFMEVPCQPPTLEYAPTCFPVGYDGVVTMTVRHFAPYGTGYMTYDVGGSETQRAIRIPADGHGVFSAQFKVTPANRDHPGEGTDSNRAVLATATWSPCPPGTTTTTTAATTTTSTTEPETTTTTRPGSTTTTTRPNGPTTTLPVPVELPPPTPGATLTLTPRLGPPGFVTGVRGTGFPPNTTVALHWQPGVGTATALVGADGAFATRVLVLPNDQLGPRALVATSGATTAFDAFLVVPSTVKPSGGQNVAQLNRIRRFLKR